MQHGRGGNAGSFSAGMTMWMRMDVVMCRFVRMRFRVCVGVMVAFFRGLLREWFAGFGLSRFACVLSLVWPRGGFARLRSEAAVGQGGPLTRYARDEV